MAGAPVWESTRWRRWRARQLGAVGLTAGVLLSSGELPWCNSRDCVVNAEDRATASVVRPIDGPPTIPVSTSTIMVSGTASWDDQIVGPFVITIHALPTVHGGSASWW